MATAPTMTTWSSEPIGGRDRAAPGAAKPDPRR